MARRSRRPEQIVLITLRVVTSLCSERPGDEFRYCVSGDVEQWRDGKIYRVHESSLRGCDASDIVDRALSMLSNSPGGLTPELVE